MSQIKLVHSGGNSSIIAAPSSNPASDVTFRLPNADGSANEFLKTDGSGNLSFAAVAGGKFASYAIIGDQKAYNENGGSFTSGDWRTRDLNTEFADEDGIVSISNNQFTLQAGTYYLTAKCTAYKSERHLIKLQNITDASLVAVSLSMYQGGGDSQSGISHLSTRFTISGAKTFEIQHRGSNTENTYGFGVAHNYSGFNTIYSLIEIFKES